MLPTFSDRKKNASARRIFLSQFLIKFLIFFAVHLEGHFLPQFSKTSALSSSFIKMFVAGLRMRYVGARPWRCAFGFRNAGRLPTFLTVVLSFWLRTSRVLYRAVEKTSLVNASSVESLPKILFMCRSRNRRCWCAAKKACWLARILKMIYLSILTCRYQLLPFVLITFLHYRCLFLRGVKTFFHSVFWFTSRERSPYRRNGHFK